MEERRSHSGYAYSDKMGLVLAGGENYYGKLLRSVEKTYGSSFEPMAPLPESNGYNCLVSANSDSLYLTGGDNGATQNQTGRDNGATKNQTLQFNSSTCNWTKVADMIEYRQRHGCGFVDGPNAKSIVVVGGYNGLHKLNKTEIYDIKEGSWRQGTPFPHPISSPASVQYDGTLLIVGGCTVSNCSDEIYKYVPTSESWEQLDVRLKKPASDHVAFMVPVSIFPSCSAAPATVAVCCAWWVLMFLIHATTYL